jgi:uncharacterized protein with HEPN domain
MKERSFSPRLADMIVAIGHIRSTLAGISLDDFAGGWQKRWVVERGLEIVSEASRHLPEAMKLRRPEIPWQKVAGIGNVLRHNYERIAPDVLWKLVQDDLPALEKVCCEEFAALDMRGASG